MTVLPFRRRSRVLPIVLAALAFGFVSFVVTWAFLTWPGGTIKNSAQVIRPGPAIEPIDGDTVRAGGKVYRLVGFDTPERGYLAKCDDERRRADAATARLRDLLATGQSKLEPVACACRAGTEGTSACNFGRLCASLSIGGRDVGAILVGEGLAHPYICSATSCPKRRPWC
jgi:endonuclease YncB( thermonuclease family)